MEVIWILISLRTGGERHLGLYYNNNCYTLLTATFEFHKATLFRWGGRVFWCEISSGYRTPKSIEIDSVFTGAFQN